MAEREVIKCRYLTSKKFGLTKLNPEKKTHEYREVKDYWFKRLFLYSHIQARQTMLPLHSECIFCCGYPSKQDVSKRLRAKIKSICIRNGLETDLKIDRDVFDIHFELMKENKKMTFEEFIIACKRTYAWQGLPDIEVCMLCMGLAGETGEVIDYLKKVGFQGHEFNKEKLKSEMGDMMWYFAMLCDFFNISFEDVLKANIEKLKKRYPDGFDEEKSKNRE